MKKKTLKIILIVLGVLLSPILLLILGWLLVFLITDFSISKVVRENKHEIFSYVAEYKASENMAGVDRPIAFYYDYSGLLDSALGYYFSPDDTYWIVNSDVYDETASCEEPLSRKDAKRYKKGYRTEDRYYTEKICDNWYYFECPSDD